MVVDSQRGGCNNVRTFAPVGEPGRGAGRRNLAFTVLDCAGRNLTRVWPVLDCAPRDEQVVCSRNPNRGSADVALSGVILRRGG